MDSDQQPANPETEVRSKTLLILGLTFILPIVITLMGVYYFL